MARIGLIVPSVHQNLEGWIAGLQGLGHEVRIEAVRLSARKSGAMTEALGVEVRSLPESRWSAYLRRTVRGRDKGRKRFFPELAVLAERLTDHDLIIARTYSVPLLIAIRLALRDRRTRFLVYEQYDPRPPLKWWRLRRDRNRSLTTLLGTLRLRALGRLLADGIVSPVTQTPIEEALGDPSVVPFAVVRPAERATPVATDRDRQVEGPLRVLMIARFEPRKRHDLAIDAVATLRDQGRDVQLTIVGQAYGPREESFHEHVLGLVRRSSVADQVKVEMNLGPNDVARRYADHDVLILPAEREPASVVVVEGAVRGLPVVLSRTCGTACYVRDGVTGIHVDEGSSSALMEALRLLADDDDLRRSMAAAAAHHVRRLTEPAAVARRLLSVSD